MNSPEASVLRNLVIRSATVILTTIVLAAVARAWIPSAKVSPDFIAFWTAARLLSSGQSPYDAALQGDIQQGLGWDPARDGLGIYDFLPYYYPPWFGLACVALLPLGYPSARTTWLVLNAELLLFAGFLLKDAVEGIPRKVSFMLVTVFAPSLLATVLGQISPLILFLIVAAWALLKNGRQDFAAGGVLALATTKPQLTALLTLAILCRAARSGRWGVIRGFIAVLAVLCLIGFAAVPDWPLAMVKATEATPLPHVVFPGSGCSWLIMLNAVGLRGRLLAASYSLLAIPFVVGILRLAVDPQRRLDDLICLSLIGSFIVAPYIRNYDLPILLVPVLVLIGSRIREIPGCVLLIALLVIPYFQHLVLTGRRTRIEAAMLEYTYFWIPLVILIVWRCSRSNERIVEGPALRTDGCASL